VIIPTTITIKDVRLRISLIVIVVKIVDTYIYTKSMIRINR